ncbi:MAG: YidC/Oxa1 family membrane protein insertase [Eggerthellaceae bacterium]|jgi:YidC/Oxa1 family membrane protein insertase
MWEAFKNLIFQIIEFFYTPFGDWGMAIVVVTIIFRIIIAPLMHSQTKSNYKMQKVQPLMAEIQQKYADDPMRQQEELQKLYADAKFNPLIGCLPIFLQMPIFIALFQVLRDLGNRPEVASTNYSFYNLVPNLVYTPADAFGYGFVAFLPYLILMIVFAGATFLPMILQVKDNKNTQQRNQTLIMSGVMSLFMLWLSWSSPAGVLLFWGVSSIIAVGQQQFTQARLKRADREKEAQEEAKPVVVSVERRQQKKRQSKKH